MKKVWVINHYAVPPELGTFVRQFQFAKNLKEIYDFEIFTSSQIHNSNLNIREKKKNIKTKLYEGVKFNFIKTISYSNNSYHRIINMLEFAIKLLFLSSKKFGKPSIVYLSSPCLISSFFGVILGKMKKTKIVMEVRDIWPYSIVDYSNNLSKNSFIIRALSLVEKFIYRNADAIIFTMPGGKEYIKDRGWDEAIPEKKIFYVNNGVDLEEFENTIQSQEIEDEDLLSEKIKFIYTGSIRKANNILSLVVAFSKIETDALLLIYGLGDEVSLIEEYILNNAIKNIKYKGKVEKQMIPAILSKGDFNILTYLPLEESLVRKYGSSQNKLFEYLASGKPIISNQKYGKHDIVNFCKCGLVYQCNTEIEYEKLFTKALEIKSTDYEILKNNAKLAVNNFDWKYLSKKIEKIFQYIEK